MKSVFRIVSLVVLAQQQLAWAQEAEVDDIDDLDSDVGDDGEAAEGEAEGLEELMLGLVVDLEDQAAEAVEAA